MAVASAAHSLKLDEAIITTEVQHDLDALGIAKTAREEKLRAQRARLSNQDNERMAKLYRQHILKEQSTEPEQKLVQIQLGGLKKGQPEATGAAGD